MHFSYPLPRRKLVLLLGVVVAICVLAVLSGVLLARRPASALPFPPPPAGGPSDTVPLSPNAFGLPRDAIEDVAKRTEKSVTFRLSDGRFAAVSVGTPLFRRLPDGTHIPVDDRGRREGDMLVFDRLAEGVTIRLSLERPTYTLDQNGKAFSVSFPQDVPGRPEDDHTVAYDLATGVTLRWRVAGTQVQETIEVREKNIAPHLSWQVTPSTGLTTHSEESILTLVDATGETRFTFKRPVLTTPAGEPLSVPIDLRSTPQGYRFAYNEAALLLPYVIDPSSGPNSGGTFANDTTVGNVAWTNASNATASDDAYASVPTGTSDITQYLKATNFGFAIPSGSTIDGIVSEVERVKSGASVVDNSVKIVKNGSITGTEKADTVSQWPATDAYATYGSSSDLWGTTWTVSDINSSNFGVVISANVVDTGIAGDSQAKIDHVRITVTYTAGVSLSGTVYTDEGSTALGSVTVAVSINGAAAAGTTTSNATTGAYTLSGLTISAGDVLTLYIDGASQDAVTVTRASGDAQTSLDLYQNRLITRCDNSCSLTNSNLDTADGNGDADISALYGVTSSTLTVAAGKELFIPSSHTFAPAGAVTAHHVDINGTFTGAANAITVSGDWDITGGSFTSTGTVTLNGVSQSLTGSTTFSGLTKTVTSEDTLTVASGSTQTVTGALIFRGASNATLRLRSGTSGTQWRIDPQGTRSVTYVDVKDSNNVNTTAITCTTSCTNSGNNTNWNFGAAPTATTPSGMTQAKDGTGLVTFTTTIDDVDRQETDLIVEYSLDAQSWKSVTIGTVTASVESVTVDNTATAQIQGIDTDTSAVKLTIVWKSKNQISNREEGTVYLRVTPRDGTRTGSGSISESFAVDNGAPEATNLRLAARTSTSLTITWTINVKTETNFGRYKLCLNSDRTRADPCRGPKAIVWDVKKDPALATLATTQTTIPGLARNVTYRTSFEARDTFGNHVADKRNFTTSDDPLPPTLFVTGAGDTFVSLGWDQTEITPFQRYELCYGTSYYFVAEAPNCPSFGGTIRKLYPAGNRTITSDTLTNLKPKTTYTFRLAVRKTTTETVRSNVVVERTCPTGHTKIRGVCTKPKPVVPPPTSTPTPSPTPTPTPTPTPVPSPSPTPPPPSPTPTAEPPLVLLPPPGADPVGEIRERIVAVVERIVRFIKNVIEAIRQSPIIRAIAPIAKKPATRAVNLAVAATVTAVILVSSPALVAAPTAFSQLPYVLPRLWQAFLGLLGFRSKRRPWGRVADAYTGTPIPGALVHIVDHQTQKIRDTVTADARGGFASFLPAGTYNFAVQKPGWALTPQTFFLRVVGGERTYDGRPVQVTGSRLVPIVLALRAIDEALAPRRRWWRITLQRLELVLWRISWGLLLFGAVLNTVILLADPIRLNGAIEVLYVLLIAWKLRLQFRHRRALGSIRDDRTGAPLAFAVVRLYEAVTGRIVATRVADAAGKFLLLTTPGVYTVSVVKDGYTPYSESHLVIRPEQEALGLDYRLTPTR